MKAIFICPFLIITKYTLFFPSVDYPNKDSSILPPQFWFLLPDYTFWHLCVYWLAVFSFSHCAALDVAGLFLRQLILQKPSVCHTSNSRCRNKTSDLVWPGNSRMKGRGGPSVDCEPRNCPQIEKLLRENIWLFWLLTDEFVKKIWPANVRRNILDVYGSVYHNTVIPRLTSNTANEFFG